ncbi:MAG: hypothetical protein JWN48_5010 [Myxococcaceae bacterium]|nr:hypothetical protein [Myxococcaceae bacterium]
MGHFRVDASSKSGVIILELHGALSVEEVQQLVAEYTVAVEALRGAPYRVFGDLRNMLPLSPEAASAYQSAKAASALQPNFQGSAVLVASSVVAMQHRRTSIEGGVSETELISSDEAACWDFLRRVQRPRR